MGLIQTAVLAHDIIDRLDNAVVTGQLSSALFKKLVAEGRVYDAMNEALLYFCVSDVPRAALRHLVSSKLHPLTLVSTDSDTNISTYYWPDTAHRNRADGGLLALFLNGESFAFQVITDPTELQFALMVLQNMGANTTMYGASFKKAIISLVDNLVYAPSGVRVEARIAQQPEPIGIEVLSYGLFTLVVTGAVLASGTLLVENTINGHTLSVELVAGESAEVVAQKIAAAIQAESSAMELRAEHFADEVRIKTIVMGSAGNESIRIPSHTTGVTFNLAVDTIEPISAAKSTELPVDVAYQEQIGLLAFNHLINMAVNQVQKPELIDE